MPKSKGSVEYLAKKKARTAERRAARDQDTQPQQQQQQEDRLVVRLPPVQQQQQHQQHQQQQQQQQEDALPPSAGPGPGPILSSPGLARPVVRLPGMPLAVGPMLKRKRSVSPAARKERPAPGRGPVRSSSGPGLPVVRPLAPRPAPEHLGVLFGGPRPLGGPQSDQRKTLEAIPARNPTTAEDADVRGVVPPRLSGQASASGLGIPRASSNAGPQVKLFAGSDSLERVNRTLTDEGFLEFRYMSNEYVIRHYGECSAEGHAIVGLMQDGILAELRASLGAYQRDAVVSGAIGCLNVDVRKFMKKFGGTCPRCDKPRRYLAARHRVAAMLNEPPENLWMAFVYLDKTSKKTRMFDASHRCCTASSNFCIHSEHAYLETKKTNDDRSKHQRGHEVCDHADLPCLSIKKIQT
jgi:hypothetical protein